MFAIYIVWLDIKHRLFEAIKFEINKYLYIYYIYKYISSTINQENGG